MELVPTNETILTQTSQTESMNQVLTLSLELVRLVIRAGHLKLLSGRGTWETISWGELIYTLLKQ